MHDAIGDCSKKGIDGVTPKIEIEHLSSAFSMHMGGRWIHTVQAKDGIDYFLRFVGIHLDLISRYKNTGKPQVLVEIRTNGTVVYWYGCYLQTVFIDRHSRGFVSTYDGCMFGALGTSNNLFAFMDENNNSLKLNEIDFRVHLEK